MIRLLADENFDQDLVRGVLRRRPGFDVVRAQDVGLLEATTAQVVKAGPGILCRVSVIVIRSTAGTANDVATTGGAAVANEFGTIPNVIGT